MYRYPHEGSFTETCYFGKIGSWAAGWHIGVDLVGENKEIYPVYKGTVQAINDDEDKSDYGKYIKIKQDDGIVALYAHFSQINVAVGDEVDYNTVIGIEGSTGNSSGSHLHLEMHVGSYKYPTNTKQEDVTWLLDPLEYIGNQIPSAWASSSWQSCEAVGALDGLNPKENLTREQFACVLVRLGLV